MTQIRRRAARSRSRTALLISGICERRNVACAKAGRHVLLAVLAHHVPEVAGLDAGCEAEIDSRDAGNLGRCDRSSRGLHACVVVVGGRSGYVLARGHEEDWRAEVGAGYFACDVAVVVPVDAADAADTGSLAGIDSAPVGPDLSVSAFSMARGA